MQYLRHLYFSVSQLGFYRQIIMSVDGLKARRHFLISYCLIAAGVSSYFSLVTTPPMYSFATQAFDALIMEYPQDLTLTIDPEYQLQVNLPTPILIPLPASLQTDSFKNLMAIDPSLPAKATHEHQAYLLLSSTAFGLATNTPLVGQYQELGLQGSLDYPQLADQLTALNNSVSELYPYRFIILWFSLLIGFLGGYGLYALMLTFILSTIGELLSRPYPYRQYLHISLYIIPLIHAITLIQQAIYGTYYVDMFFIFYGLVAIIILLSLPKAIRIKLPKS